MCVSDETYLLCINEVRQDLITSTAAISALSTFLMGALANLPVGLAPGLGLNAYVSTTILASCGARHPQDKNIPLNFSS
jgi:AGZA family xanthine/uracil permease-like MFS transporter